MSRYRANYFTVTIYRETEEGDEREIVVTGTYAPEYGGRYGGPPDNWEPPEPAEVSIDSASFTDGDKEGAELTEKELEEVEEKAQEYIREEEGEAMISRYEDALDDRSERDLDRAEAAYERKIYGD